MYEVAEYVRSHSVMCSPWEFWHCRRFMGLKATPPTGNMDHTGLKIIWKTRCRWGKMYQNADHICYKCRCFLYGYFLFNLRLIYITILQKCDNRWYKSPNSPLLTNPNIHDPMLAITVPADGLAPSSAGTVLTETFQLLWSSCFLNSFRPDDFK